MAWFFRRESCSEQLRQVQDRLDTAEAQLRTLRTEWVEQLDKFQHLVERFVKRVERSEKGNGAARGEAEAAPLGVDPISARILARRSHGVRSQLRSEQG